MSSLKGVWSLLAPFHKRFYQFFVLAIVYETVAVFDSYILSFSIERISGADIQMLAFWIGAILVFDEIHMRLDNKFDWIADVEFDFKIYEYLNTKILKRFLGMDLSWHHQQKSGTLLGKVNNGVDKITDLVRIVGRELVPTVLQLSISAIPLSYINPWVTLLVVIAFVGFVTLTIKQQGLQKPFREARYQHYDDSWARGMDAVTGIGIVQTYNAMDDMQDQYNSIHRGIREQGTSESHIGIYQYNRWKIRISSYARRAILGLLLYQTMQGQINVAQLVFAWTLTEKLMYSFWRIAHLIDHIAKSSEGIKRYVDIANLTPSIVNPDDPQTPNDDFCTITLQDVSYAHPNETDEPGEDCIRNISLTIKPGESIAIVGPSGAGKSTLIQLLPRLIDATDGTVMINGVDVCDWDLVALRGLFGLVSQDYAIMDGTFEQNIAIGDLNASQYAIEQAARKAGIHKFIVGCAQGYETQLGERGILLSGGQKQRVALARAFLKMPHILILDEPTSALDSLTEAKLQEALEEFYKDPHVTVIVIAHRLATIKNCNRIVVMDKGQIVEEGTHKDLIEHRGMYANLHELQNIS